MRDSTKGSKMRHDLLRISPVFGTVRVGAPQSAVKGSYIASCSCGKKIEASTKSKTEEAFKKHKEESE